MLKLIYRANIQSKLTTPPGERRAGFSQWASSRLFSRQQGSNGTSVSCSILLCPTCNSENFTRSGPSLIVRRPRLNVKPPCARNRHCLCQDERPHLVDSRTSRRDLCLVFRWCPYSSRDFRRADLYTNDGVHVVELARYARFATPWLWIGYNPRERPMERK